MKLHPTGLRLACLLSLSFMSLPAQSSAPTATKLGSTVFFWEKLAVRPTGNGERRDVTDGPTATFARFESHVTTLLPGRLSHAPHQHPQEELIILRDGTLDVTINGVTTRVGPGSLLFFAANDFHNVQNVGDTPATYFVFNFATGITGTLAGKSAAQLAAPGQLGSGVYDWAKLAVKPTKTGERRDVFDTPTTTLTNFECHVTTLQPGIAPHASHHHADEEIMLVKEGVMEVTLGSATTRAGPGSIIFAASNQEHGWRNAGDTPATYYVIRIVTDATPKPLVP
jgi:quercetin dioxygenase-like cupin family protein